MNHYCCLKGCSSTGWGSTAYLLLACSTLAVGLIAFHIGDTCQHCEVIGVPPAEQSRASVAIRSRVLSVVLDNGRYKKLLSLARVLSRRQIGLVGLFESLYLT